MPYIYSTMTCDNRYDLIKDGKVVGTVLIKGGANHAVIGDTTSLVPGALTEVTNEELEILQASAEGSGFKMHLKGGFLKIDNKKNDVERAVADMTKKDKSAPRTKSEMKSPDLEV